MFKVYLWPGKMVKWTRFGTWTLSSALSALQIQTTLELNSITIKTEQI